MPGLPGAILFACGHNIVRSPVAEAIMKHYHGRRVFVDSVGVRIGEAIDPFAVTVMAEIGLQIAGHRPKSFDDLEDRNYDLVVTLTPEAQHRAVELTRTMACEVEYWPTLDPTAVHGSREQRLEAYRSVRRHLVERILTRFPLDGVQGG